MANPKTEFDSKEEIVATLQTEWGEKPACFYNTPTNKQHEKFWTYNRCLQHLFNLRRNYVRTPYGRYSIKTSFGQSLNN